ncbi:winged helix-turn-helix domain-containing protein [Malacoplasma iowae]|uniref:Transcriptional regulator, GntR family n=2 Tax=Malacoplasma iowae TaxID=2116 RepID=A0A084U4S0_MALIO|nr:winged helix-turn-helix domain-containing protein [Malacoplasma iowae]VEU61701.1 DNA-binding transcriptional repressor MngR [Mycoplasmopsis fermentans]EGZ31355.1 hypothetical protein GUU_02309 [Malacoplasma iowae 695]KFB07956.1 transcriptional regulator, GntR family [Malacoplasma iowae DK-CPA]QHG90165.1 winged helix-turn-helix domain-containing protein [Malacoplasma iowae 695]WPL36088.1 winged helix-turn-helix domain-containing protein [Malacoplasma iowae]
MKQENSKVKINSVNSVKRYITNYLILKILTGDYPLNKKIPSENNLAEKFKCSRLTSRSALLVLNNASVLDAIRGSGYIVSEEALKILMPPKFVQEKSDSQKTKAISTTNDFITLETTYFKDNKIIGVVTWDIAKYVYIEMSKKYSIEENVCDNLIQANLDFTLFEEHVELDKEGRILLVKTNFDQESKIIFRSATWYEDIKKLTTKTVDLI